MSIERHLSLPEALKLASELERVGRLSEADELACRILTLQPDLPDALYRRGMIANSRGNKKAAADFLRRAIAKAPDRIPYLGNLGLVLMALGEMEEAIAILLKVVSLAPQSPLAHSNLGLAYGETGQRDLAERHYRQAIALDPLARAPHENLNRLLWTLDRREEVNKTYREVATQLPESAVALRNLGGALLEMSEAHDAEVILNRALTLQPGDSETLKLRALAYRRLGRFPEALADYRLVLKDRTQDPTIYEEVAATCLQFGEINSAYDYAKQAHYLAPRRQRPVALFVLAAAALGRMNEVKTFYDYDHFTHRATIDIPSGFSDLASFNSALAQELRDDRPRSWQPYDQTLRNGTMTTEDLFRAPNRLVATLHSVLRQKIGSFIATLPSDRQGHPFLDRWREDFSFTGAWSVVLREGGYHTNHIHEEGWISGVYYVSLPQVSQAAAAAHEGWLRLGAPGIEYPGAKPPIRDIEPSPGTVVLFPSYMWHGTIPFTSGGERITLAFDLQDRPT